VLFNGQVFRRLLVLLTVALSLVVAAPNASAGPGNGNSANAKLCQQGGWATLARTGDSGTPFTSQDECVRYGARGGVLTAYVPPPPTISVVIVPSVEGECVAQVSGEGFAANTSLSGRAFYTTGGDGNSVAVSVDTRSDGTFLYISPSLPSDPTLNYLIRFGGFAANEVPFACSA
jgi:hypothetical protein